MWWMKLKNRHFTHKSTEKKRKRNNVLHKEKKTIMIFFCIVICTLSYQSHDNYGLKLLEHLNPLKVCVEMTGGNGRECFINKTDTFFFHHIFSVCSCHQVSRFRMEDRMENNNMKWLSPQKKFLSAADAYDTQWTDVRIHQAWNYYYTTYAERRGNNIPFCTALQSNIVNTVIF